MRLENSSLLCIRTISRGQSSRAVWPLRCSRWRGVSIHSNHIAVHRQTLKEGSNRELILSDGHRSNYRGNLCCNNNQCRSVARVLTDCAVTGLNILRKSRNPTCVSDDSSCKTAMFVSQLLFFFSKYLMYYTMSLNNSHLFPTDIRKIRWKILSTLCITPCCNKNLYKEGASSAAFCQQNVCRIGSE